jgi:hypothetical protein
MREAVGVARDLTSPARASNARRDFPNEQSLDTKSFKGLLTERSSHLSTPRPRVKRKEARASFFVVVLSVNPRSYGESTTTAVPTDNQTTPIHTHNTRAGVRPARSQRNSQFPHLTKKHIGIIPVCGSSLEPRQPLRIPVQDLLHIPQHTRKAIYEGARG